MMQMFTSLGKQIRCQQHRTFSSKLFSFCHKFIKIITLIFENVRMYNVFNLFCYKTTDVSRYLLNKCFSASWQHLNGRNLADIYHCLKLINHLFKEVENRNKPLRDQQLWALHEVKGQPSSKIIFTVRMSKIRPLATHYAHIANLNQTMRMPQHLEHFSLLRARPIVNH